MPGLGCLVALVTISSELSEARTVDVALPAPKPGLAPPRGNSQHKLGIDAKNLGAVVARKVQDAGHVTKHLSPHRNERRAQHQGSLLTR